MLKQHAWPSFARETLSVFGTPISGAALPEIDKESSQSRS